MDDLITLTEEELFVFAALARALIRLDGRFSPEEAACLRELGNHLAAPRVESDADGPYRGATATELLGAEALMAVMERAGRAPSDDASLRDAARTITRPEARRDVHAMLYELACCDVADTRELALLDWLATEWGL